MLAGEPSKPRMVPLELPDLTEAEAASVVAGADVEAARLVRTEAADLDWSGSTIRECEVGPVAAGAWRLDRARLVDSRLRELDVTSMRARNSTWRTVEVVRGRIGALDLAGAQWDGVGWSAARLGYVNLRDSTLSDVVLADCRIETLDLGAAQCLRVALDACTIDELVVTHARLADVDLRGSRIARIEGAAGLAGATVSAEQLLDLAPQLAAELGINLG
jgi:uncharacterized protein YjbI with pentapeptide repeats